MMFDHLDDEDLLDLYTLMVEVDHYDPGETPVIIQQAREERVSQNLLRYLILKRME